MVKWVLPLLQLDWGVAWAWNTSFPRETCCKVPGVTVGLARGRFIMSVCAGCPVALSRPAKAFSAPWAGQKESWQARTPTASSHPLWKRTLRLGPASAADIQPLGRRGASCYKD